MIAATARVLAAGPYKGLEHYSESDAPFFFGREAETELIVANALASRLTLVYGESGVGKSSLLRAGVARTLRDDPELVVVVFASWLGNPVAALAAELRAVAGLGRPPSDAPLVETLAACTERLGRDLVVILDQFEAYFVYHGGEDGEGTFAVEFPRAVGRLDLPVSFVLSIREDALARLDRFKGRIPRLFDNYLRIRHLDRPAAREAIVRPLERLGEAGGGGEPVGIEPTLVEAVLDQVEAGKVALGRVGAGSVDGGGGGGEARIEAPYLQLVLTRIWDEEVAAGSRQLRLETLTSLGGAERIVRTHLDAAMDSLTAEDRDVAARVFRYLVTPSGTKIAHSAGDLAEYGEAPAPAVERVVERLAGGDVRILRPVAAGTYEIYHDVLAAPILDWRERFLRAREEAQRERKRRRRWWRGLAVALVVAAAGVAAAVLALRDQQQETQAVQQQADAALEQVDELARAVAFYKALYEGHDGPVTSAEFSPDGRLVATASTDGTVRVWDWRQAQAATPRPLFVRFLGARARYASFSPEGRRLVTASGSRADVLDARTGAILLTIRGPSATITSAFFTPDGQGIVTAGSGPARFWTARAGRLIGQIGTDVAAAELSRDGRVLVTVSRAGLVASFDVRSRRRVPTVYVAGVTVATISPDGKLVATAGERVEIRDLAGTIVKRLVPRDRTFDLAFSPDGRLLVTAGSKDARVWAWREGLRLAELRGHSDIVRSAAFDPTGKLIATASDDQTARVWDLSGVELALSDVSFEVRSKSSLRARARVTNLGTTDSPRTAVDLRIGRTTGPRRGGTILPPRSREPGAQRRGSRAVVPRLPSGENAVVTIDVPLAAGAGARTETAFLVLDPDNDIDELNERNDTVRVTTTVPAASLQVYTLGIDRIGDSVVVTTRVENTGLRSMPAVIRAEVGGWPRVDTRLPTLAPGASTRLEIPLEIPARTDPTGEVVTVTLFLNGTSVDSDRTAPLEPRR